MEQAKRTIYYGEIIEGHLVEPIEFYMNTYCLGKFG